MKSVTRAIFAAALSCAGAVQAQVQVIGPEPVTVDESTIPERHQVGKDETLSMLAERFLGNGDAWPKLWSYNPEVTNPHWIYPGLVLRLKPGVPLDAPADASAAGAPANGMKTLQFATRRHANAGSGTVLIGEEVYLDGDALEHAGKIVGAPEDHLMMSPSDEVYLQFKQLEPRPNQELTLFLRQPRHTVAPPANEHGPAPKVTKGGGEVVRVVGALRIKDYDAKKKVARAVITEALEPIERGFEVTDVPHRLALVPPRKNAKELAGHIVSSSRGLGQLANEQIVFIDLGSKAGVEVGNRLHVTRQGDPWRKTLKQKEERFGALVPETHPIATEDLPVETVGELHVLYVRPESSTAIVVASPLELNPGDRVEMKAGY
ncbi:MAG TPA: LysM peptidoglycan-binding domain-containing protein [Polyangiales bacterium]|nr:LysM peptidoglycan-binding domain-containing protein [Polyangiales bacterium]